MNEDKSMSMVAMLAISSVALIGCKYLMCNPEARKNMKNMAKSATKKLYQKLDEMD